MVYSGSASPDNESGAWDRLYGNQHVSSSFGEHYEPVLQDDAFMVGRTGGPGNGYMCDGILLKSGEPFRISYQRAQLSAHGIFAREVTYVRIEFACA